jgi:hypothetical protein
MLCLIVLVIFLLQFLVALAALMFAVFLARPEVPFLARNTLEAITPAGHHHFSPCLPERKTSASGKNALRSSRKPTK